MTAIADFEQRWRLRGKLWTAAFIIDVGIFFYRLWLEGTRVQQN